jgi:2-keto-4-pentenoate hydratase/2-oxohepta-3-ene-1,7-dioic acid hydratase in catechol pathway
MKTTRREIMTTALAGAAAASAQSRGSITKFVRFRKGGLLSHGSLEGGTIQAITGDLFGKYQTGGGTYKLSEVKLLYPIQPPKIVALAGNYRSHLGNRKPPDHPEPFYKPITALQNPEDPIIFPSGATNVHFEGELVFVIGRRAKNVTVEQARQVIFGVTCGNDVSERDWQNGPQKDTQWWRAKGADTFAPLGPAIVRGLDYGNLKIETRLNGKVVQKDSTDSLIHDGPTTVSFVSQFVTLQPGDLIFTGTSGTTSKMSPGDIVEVEIEGIGILRNKVIAG